MAPMPPSAAAFRRLSIAATLLLTLVHRAAGVVDYCNDHNFDTDTTHLQFTKEISSKEYALAGKFKSLHCCAKGYRSIEWFKDGAPYPWSSGVSNLILYPESANQTVYAQTVSTADMGNYSCLVRNDSHALSHSVLLYVFESEVEEVGYTGPPLATYKPRDQFASRGQAARFFCEAFVGRVDLPDARSEVRWWRSIPSSASSAGDSGVENVGVKGVGAEDGGNWVIATESASVAAAWGVGGGGGRGDLAEEPSSDPGSRHHHHHMHQHHQYHHAKHHAKPKPRFHQEVVPREDNQILGAYLLIREVQNEDYGEYSCSIRNAGGEDALHMSSWLREREEEEPEVVEKKILPPLSSDNAKMVFALLVLMSMILVFLGLLFLILRKSNVCHLLKKMCKKREDSDGKEYGICVFYEDKGRTFSAGTNLETSKCMTLSSIVPAFEPYNGYHCFTQPPPNMDHLPLTDGEKGADDCTQVR